MTVAASSASALSARRDQGVAWMNRGHTLMLLGDDASIAASLAAYDEAIALLRALPVAENPSWANSFAAALMNRGQLLHRRYGVDQATLALAAFDEAIATLRPLVPSIENPKSKVQNLPNPWPRRNLAGTLLNRANLLLDLARQSSACDTAREALALSLPHERVDQVDADLALKASRALCDALGHLLVIRGADQHALATEASDLTDDALALIRHWTDRGETGFQILTLRFFRYGTQLYRFHQPHFLAEFIRESLPFPADEFRTVALEAIDAALADRPRGRPFLTMGDASSERHLQIGRELAALRIQLGA